jgi:hypothetical protein
MGWHNIFGSDNKYFRLVGHTVFAVTTQLCCQIATEAMDKTVKISIKLFTQLEFRVGEMSLTLWACYLCICSEPCT